MNTNEIRISRAWLCGGLGLFFWAGLCASAGAYQLVAWGEARENQNVVPGTVGEVTMAAAGKWHSLIANPERTVVAWGGLVSSVTNVPPGLSEVLAICRESEARSPQRMQFSVARP